MRSSLSLWLPRIFAGLIFVGALALVNQFFFPKLNPYYQDTIIKAGFAVILAVSLNLINGITGQFSLGHAGFMAIGAYVSAYFTKEIGMHIVGNAPQIQPLNFAFSIIVGAMAAGLAGLVVGLPSLRLRGDYLAIVTLGFNQIIVSIIQNLSVVGGASGYTDIPKHTNFVWVAAMVTLCILSIRNLASSRLGRSMRAVRDDEVAAEAAGINTTQVKIIAFVFSSMWAGVAGALYAHYNQYLAPGGFTFVQSVEVVVAVVLGGLGSITGSALAAAGLTVLTEVLREVPGVFYTSLGLIALAAYWSFLANRTRIQRSASGLASWLWGPIASVVVTCVLYFGYYPWLNDNKSQLRYVLYSIILIVLMLLRPQGIFGRAEISFAALKGRTRRKAALTT